MDETVDGLDKALVDNVPLGDSDPAEVAQRLPYHRLGPGGGAGKGDFVLVPLNRPEVARLEVALAVPPGFEWGLIHGQPLALENRG